MRVWGLFVCVLCNFSANAQCGTWIDARVGQVIMEIIPPVAQNSVYDQTALIY